MAVRDKVWGLLTMVNVRPPGDDDVFCPLLEPEIIELENRIGSELPLHYREFLLEIGGVAVSADVRPIEPRPEFGEIEHVSYFYGSREREIFSLELALDDYAERVPSTMIPIAVGPYGDLFCLCVKGKNAGRVYFWDHDNEGGENLTLVSETFLDMLNRLISNE